MTADSIPHPRVSKSTPHPARFHAYTKYGPDCCEWQGYIDPDGYGRYYNSYRFHSAHRMAYELHHGPIPEGMVIDHLCGNRSCVRPEHLEAVSIAENNRRKIGNSPLHRMLREITRLTPQELGVLRDALDRL